jgi:ABC-type spermidine/putrescine transport system permease subunit I
VAQYFIFAGVATILYVFSLLRVYAWIGLLGRGGPVNGDPLPIWALIRTKPDPARTADRFAALSGHGEIRYLPFM